MGIAQQLRQFGKATEGILRKLLPPEPGMEELAAAVGYVEYAGNPYSYVTPDFIGQRLRDTTNNVWYRAYGATSTTWRPDAQGVLDSSGNMIGLAGVHGPNRYQFNRFFQRPIKTGFPFLAFPRSASAHSTITNSNNPVPSYTTRDGIPVVRITTNSGAQSSLNFSSITGRLIPLGSIHLLFWIEDPSKIASISVAIADGPGYSNAYIWSGLISSGSWPGWYQLTIDPPASGTYSGMSLDADQARWSVAAGTPNFASTLFTDGNFSITANSSMQGVVEFAGCWVGEQMTAPAPSIIFTSDDTEETWYTVALPILEKYGLRGTQCIIDKYIGTSGHLSLAQMQDAYARGHEFIPHGIGTFPEVGGSVGDMRDFSTVAQMVADIERNRSTINTYGLTRNKGGINCYAYPSGIYQISTTDTKIQQALDQCGIKYARLAAPFYGATIANRFQRLSGKYIGICGHYYERNGAPESANIARVILRMQQAIANGRSVCFMNHTYVTSPVDIGGIKPSDFELICVAAANLINAGSARNLLFSEYALECDDAADQWV